MRPRANGLGSKKLLTELKAGATILRREAAEIAKDADLLHKRIGRVHLAADRLHRKIEQTHGRIRIYRSRNGLARGRSAQKAKSESD